MLSEVLSPQKAALEMSASQMNACDSLLGLSSRRGIGQEVENEADENLDPVNKLITL